MIFSSWRQIKAKSPHASLISSSTVVISHNLCYKSGLHLNIFFLGALKHLQHSTGSSSLVQGGLILQQDGALGSTLHSFTLHTLFRDLCCCCKLGEWQRCFSNQGKNKEPQLENWSFSLLSSHILWDSTEYHRPTWPHLKLYHVLQ